MTDEEKKKLSPLAKMTQGITDMTQKILTGVAATPQGRQVMGADNASSVLDSMATKYMNDYNNAKFSYDMYNDPVYQIARDAYMKQGQQAAKNVQAQAAQYTGGYGNSYGAMAAQQQYNAALGQLNDIVPDLQNAAYGRFEDEQNRNLRMADWYKGLGDQAYERGQTERANQLALAQIAADFGDLEGLKGFGINTSKYESDLAEEKQKAADTAAWNKALQAAEMGDYEPLKKLGVDTSSQEQKDALNMAMYWWENFQDPSLLKALNVPMDYLYAQAGLDANGNPITAATGYTGSNYTYTPQGNDNKGVDDITNDETTKPAVKQTASNLRNQLRADQGLQTSEDTTEARRNKGMDEVESALRTNGYTEAVLENALNKLVKDGLLTVSEKKDWKDFYMQEYVNKNKTPTNTTNTTTTSKNTQKSITVSAGGKGKVTRMTK